MNNRPQPACLWSQGWTGLLGNGGTCSAGLSGRRAGVCKPGRRATAPAFPDMRPPTLLHRCRPLPSGHSLSLRKSPPPPAPKPDRFQPPCISLGARHFSTLMQGAHPGFQHPRNAPTQKFSSPTVHIQIVSYPLCFLCLHPQPYFPSQTLEFLSGKLARPSQPLLSEIRPLCSKLPSNQKMPPPTSV